MTFNIYILLLTVVIAVGVAVIWNGIFSNKKRKANILYYTVLASFAGLLIGGYFLDSWEAPMTAIVAAVCAYLAVQSGRFKKVDTPMIIIFVAGGVILGYILYSIFGALTNNWGSIPSIVYVIIACTVMAQGKLDDIKIAGVTVARDKK